jgi:hypothetical protein
MVVKVQGAIRPNLKDSSKELPKWLSYDKATNTYTAKVEPKGTRTISESKVEGAATVFSKLDTDGKMFMLKMMFPGKTDEELEALAKG